MNRSTIGILVVALVLLTVVFGPRLSGSGAGPGTLTCVEAMSSGSQPCQDAGGFASTCATATCPAGYTLTGGGGACAAGNRKIKSLFPRSAKGQFVIACEEQGVAPQAVAICCKL